MLKRQIELAKYITEYSKSQIDTWRQIPRLALYANGITGWNGSYYTAYAMGLLRLESGMKYGGYSITVDLATGNITRFNQLLNLEESYTAVLELCALDYKELDAMALKERLIIAAERPYGTYTDVNKVAEVREQYKHIKKYYIREGDIPAPYYGYG